MARHSQLSWVLFATLLVASCDYHNVKEPGLVRPRDRVDVRNLTYKFVNDNVLVPKCLSCHGRAGGVNLQSYENVVAQLHRIKERVLIQKNMPKPPRPGLDAVQHDILDAWIQAGAPLGEDQPLPEPSPTPSSEPSPEPTSEPSPEPSWEPIVTTFEGVRDRILTPKCASCHKPDEQTEFDTVQNLIDFGMIVPGDPERSELLRRVRLPLDDEEHMPPDEVLPREEINAMHAWILHQEEPPTRARKGSSR